MKVPRRQQPQGVQRVFSGIMALVCDLSTQYVFVASSLVADMWFGLGFLAMVRGGRVD